VILNKEADTTVFAHTYTNVYTMNTYLVATVVLLIMLCLFLFRVL